MLILLPVLILITASISLQVLGRVKFSPGQTWLVSSIVAIVTWISMILLRILMPSGVEIGNWLTGNKTSESIVFHFTGETWVFGFLLISLLVAVVFHEARYLDSGSHVNILTGTMMLTAFGLISIQSGNGLTFLLSWVLIDIAEFAILIGVIKDVAKHQISVISLLTRILGIILMLCYLVIQNPTSTTASNTGNVNTGILLLFIAILRMGIIPLHIPYSEEPKIRRGVGSILRFIPILSVFSFLIFFGPQLVSSLQNNGFLTILTLGVVFGAISWFFARSDLGGRPYWIFAFGCLALIAFLRSSTESLVGLASMMVTGGSGLFLFLPRKRKAGLVLPLLLSSMLAIPYTPSAVVPLALWSGRGFAANLVLLPSLALLVGGVIRHSLRNAGSKDTKEDWIWLFQYAGLIIIAATPWIAEIFSLDQFKRIDYWWFSLAIAMMVGGVILFNRYQRQPGVRFIPRLVDLTKRLEPVFLYVDKFFQFNWFIRIVNSMGKFIVFVIGFLVRVLEGDGGILWSFLFLVLLASLIIVVQVPK